MNNDRIVVELPIKGEWTAFNTPGDIIPSHGTDIFGQTYAYDFVRTDGTSKSKMKTYKSSVIRYWTIGIPVHDFYCYKESVCSPVNGQVVVVKDGVKEPVYSHPIFEYLKVILRMFSINIESIFRAVDKIELHKFIGNYVIIKYEDYYAFFAHFSPGTIKVKEGQYVNNGDIIGEVGHSGNSTEPHLHFHMMDSPDLLTAKGVLCAFQNYYMLNDSGWEEIKNGIPKSDQRIKL